MSICGIPHSFLTAEDLARQSDGCCYGAAVNGPGSCTCWTPVYSGGQSAPAAGSTIATRATRCEDCAFRPDSPERARGDELQGLTNFACHQGVRRVVEWRHPDGRVRPGDPADYQPPIVNGVGYKADGSPMDICAGWAQAQRLRDRAEAAA